MKNNLLYPWIIECCKFTTDVFWKTIFEDIAYGIVPYPAYISKDIIQCNYKNRDFSYKIKKKDAQIIFTEILEIFKTKLNLISYNELLEKKNNLSILTKSTILDDWTSIKKKYIKEVYIQNFAILMKNKYFLSQKQAKYIFNIILLAFIYKIISADDITLENGSIQKIKGVSFENGEVIIDFNIYDGNVNILPEIINDKKLMSDEWNKFLLVQKKRNAKFR